MSLDDRQKLLLGASALGGLGVLLYWLPRASERTLTLKQLVDPSSVEYIADNFQGLSDSDFIMAAWEYVGRDIGYENYGSTLFFLDHQVRCELCLLPTRVVDTGRANCVGKSVLLASILRNRFQPQDVFVALGELHRDEVGGHAWVVVREEGHWYLLESTSSPKGWILVEEMAQRYVPHVLFNDTTVLCTSDEFCVTIPAAVCPCLNGGV